jgi:hypothetical protein
VVLLLCGVIFALLPAFFPTGHDLVQVLEVVFLCAERRGHILLGPKGRGECGAADGAKTILASALDPTTRPLILAMRR